MRLPDQIAGRPDEYSEYDEMASAAEGLAALGYPIDATYVIGLGGDIAAVGVSVFGHVSHAIVSTHPAEEGWIALFDDDDTDDVPAPMPSAVAALRVLLAR